MQSNSFFKYLFWILWVLYFTLIGVLYIVVLPGVGDIVQFMPLLSILILFASIDILIAVLVYKDALRRGMDPWLWATVAVFVPNLIGVIIYLVVRQTAQKRCVNCSRGLQGDFKVCPYCGYSQELVCEKCKREIASDWKICPYCKNPITVNG